MKGDPEGDEAKGRGFEQKYQSPMKPEPLPSALPFIR
jgi:hypothetical protein